MSDKAAAGARPVQPELPMRQIVVVVAAPQDGERAEDFAGRLRSAGVEAYAQDLASAWSDDQIRAVAAGWPEGAFVLFCLTQAGAEDALLRALIARALTQDGAERLVFVVFDEAAARREDLAALLENHPVASAAEVGPIAEHIRQHRAPASAPADVEEPAIAGAITSALERQLHRRAERRKAIEALAAEEPPQRFGARRAALPSRPPIKGERESAPLDAEADRENVLSAPIEQERLPASIEEVLEPAPIEEAPAQLEPTSAEVELAPEFLPLDAEPAQDPPPAAPFEAQPEDTIAPSAHAEADPEEGAAFGRSSETTPALDEASGGLSETAPTESFHQAAPPPDLAPAAALEDRAKRAEPAHEAPAFEPEIEPPAPAPAAPNPPLMSMDKPLQGAPPPAAPETGAVLSEEDLLREKTLRNKANASGMFANRPRASEAAPQAAATPSPPAFDRVDATAFAPKTLRRGTPELLRISVFKPKERSKALREAKRADPRTSAAGAVAQLGAVERGAVLSAVIDARGGHADQERQDAMWSGDALNFDFAITAEESASVKQALITVRLLADDAQIGAITFVRPLSRPKNDKPTKLNSNEKLRRVDRVFLSYASFDRDQAAIIASAYARAGIECFFDRVGLKSGEEWKPRLLKEINKSDLFHLCWSRAAAGSEWVEKETAHAMKRRRKAKRPDITIQMLDGPPWAPHPDSLDDLNFDDYARAAIVGYQRGRR